jgi:membrane protein
MPPFLERFVPPPLQRHMPFIKEFMREFKEDDLPGLAAELAFRFFISLFPLILVLVTLGAYISSWAGVDDPAQEVIDAIGDSLPSDASSVLSNQIEEVINGKNVGLLSVGLVTALWSASGGAGALMKAINRVYDLPETRRGPLKIGIALGLVLIGGLGLLFAVSAMIATQTFAGSIASALGMGDEFAWIVQVGRLPLVIFFVAVAIELVYWIAPNRWRRPRIASPGAIVFALGWAVFTVGFAFYVSNFGSYNATYGAIAGVVVLLFWFQISALLILMGAELNAVLERRATVAAVAPIPPTAALAGAGVRAEGPRSRGEPVFEFAILAGLLLALAALFRHRGSE